MEAELIELLRFADEAIGRYITLYLTAAAALTVLVMTEGYKKNFKPIGKVILMVCLGAVAFSNHANLVYYHQIYNSIVDILQFPLDWEGSPEHPWYCLLGAKEGALQHKPVYFVHLGHAMGGIVMGSLIWWKEIQGVRDSIAIKLKNRRSRRS